MPIVPTRGPTGPQGVVGFTGATGPMSGYSAINAKSYGAIGNGIADDTLGLQAAIDAAIAQKVPLFLPPETYKITAALTINGPITIVGSGRRLSTIHLASTTLNAIEILINVAAVSDYGQVHFSNFGITGDDTAPTAGDLINIQSASTNPVEAPVFRDLWLQNGWNGIHVVEGATYAIDNCDFYGQWNDGIVLQDTLGTDHGDGQITGCRFLGRNAVANNCAVRLRSGGGLRFTDNIVTVYDYGILVTLDAAVATSELFIGNNRINLVDIACVRIEKGSGTSFNAVTITGNKLMSAARCLDLSDVNTGWLADLAITGNVFNTLVGGTPTCVDIATATNFALVGNTFKTWGGTTPTAVSIGANASGFVGDNQIGSGFTTNIANASANVIVISPLSGTVAVTGSMTLSGGMIASGAGEFRTSLLAGTVLTLTRIGNDAFGSFLKWVKNRNASPFSHTTVQNGDELGYFSWQGDDGTAAIEAVRMAGIVDGAPGTNDMPGRWELWTTPDGSATVAKRLTVDNVGRVLAVSPLGGLGYGVGSGGSIGQLTNKATGVTLNKVTGEITLNGAALAAATIVSFVLTNSAIAATDVLLINHVSGGTLGAYTVNARCAAGSATIDVRNATAGSLSEAIVLRYTLVKGSVT